MAGLLEGLDATTWVYYIGNNGKYFGKGLYRMAEVLSDLSLINGNKDASAEYVLSYYFDFTDNTYNVIQNRVWLHQKDMSTYNDDNTETDIPALAGQKTEYESLRHE